MSNDKNETLRKLQRKLTEALDDVEFDEYFEPIPDIIKERARGGQGITKDGGAKKNLKKLANSTMLGRELLERKGRLSSETSPVTSNLTQSGQMLDSIRLTKVNGKKYIVEFEESRDDDKLNTDLVKYNEEKGRTFFGLTKTERRTLERNVQKKINALVKKTFKN